MCTPRGGYALNIYLIARGATTQAGGTSSKTQERGALEPMIIPGASVERGPVESARYIVIIIKQG